MKPEIECPFSADALREKHWKEGWRLDQLATLACVITGEEIDEEQIRAWLAEKGIAERQPGKPATTIHAPARPARVYGQQGRPKSPIETRACAHCGNAVTRRAYQFTAGPERTYCNDACHRAARQAAKQERREKAQTALAVPELGQELGILPRLKRCTHCKQELPIADFARDKERADGLANTCRACNKERCRRFYEQNREQQIERSKANKARRQEKASESDTHA